MTAARELARKNIIDRDIGDLLERLNALRKDVAYDLPGEELKQLDLEDLVSDAELFVQSVEDLLKRRS